MDRRIGLSGQASEVQTLGDSFDTMLDRISKASNIQHQLIEDTSHELRTPLAALAVNNEVMLANVEPTMEEFNASTLRSEALIARLQLGIDGPSVQRALVNLVENAARYSPQGSEVVIEVSTEPDVTLSVTDQGPGIELKEQHLVFDRYYRSSAGLDSDAGPEHRGIGLALVKQVANAHGHIHLESPLPDGISGAKFTITFASQKPTN